MSRFVKHPLIAEEMVHLTSHPQIAGETFRCANQRQISGEIFRFVFDIPSQFVEKNNHLFC